MRKHRLLVLMVLCGWSASADLSGDVNGDGAVNAADLVRARKIADGELAFEPAADVDGDSAVTKVDVWLIQEAVLGRSVPERVAGTLIGPAGGTLSHGNITVTIPPGSPLRRQRGGAPGITTTPMSRRRISPRICSRCSKTFPNWNMCRSTMVIRRPWATG